MSKNLKYAKSSAAIKIVVDPLECPFREFRDSEISPEFWGMGPAQFRVSSVIPKQAAKPAAGAFQTSQLWTDDQSQPLPKSVRHFLDGWVKAEDLASSRWDCEVVVFEEQINKMSVIDYQLTHAQVLLRSSFCRQVMSICFMLERVDNLLVEHQWEHFNFAFGPEGWRAKYHIYSPGMKAGGGFQHKPMISRNGCYLVRIYYLGAWRCVWVSDQVPVDASGAPLLPFSPISSPSQAKGKMQHTITSNVVHLWPLLLCKALLKIAAPDMNYCDEDEEEIVHDESMSELDIMHCLTGGLSRTYYTNDRRLTDRKQRLSNGVPLASYGYGPKNDICADYEELWKLLAAEVPNYNWDDDDEMQSSTVKSRSTKKPSQKDKDSIAKKDTIVSITIRDTKDCAAYALPGITPGYEMSLIVKMVRDIPLKRPLPEPEVPLWKHYRWVDWARQHGLYEAYECPRTKYLKVNGLMKLSYAPHLLDVQSTESLTFGFVEQHKEGEKTKKNASAKEPAKQTSAATQAALKEELREWIQYDDLRPLVHRIDIVFYPSLFNFASAASNPPVRITKSPMKGVDIQASKSAPLYFSIDGPEENCIKISLNMLHPRILLNAGSPVEDYIEKAYLLMECFEWFLDSDFPMPKAYVQTRGYDSMEVKFPPGRHYCRLWVHSRMNWHVALLSDSPIVLGTKDVVQAAAIHECPWVSKFLNYLSVSFTNWIRTGRSAVNIIHTDRDFFASYQPDLEWDPKIVGYDKAFVHWMFRQALQSHCYKRLEPTDYQLVCSFLRRYFCDPDFGFPPKPKPPKSLREIVGRDPCDCLMPEAEEQMEEENLGEMEREQTEEPKGPVVSSHTMAELLAEPRPPVVSNVCEVANEELPCGVLKDEREKVILKHEAATCIQAYWRGTWARKCLKTPVQLTSEIMKLLMDNAFGNFEMLSALMNEFFLIFPGAKYAYSVASGLSGVYGLDQHTGNTVISTRCKWIPYFQGVFFCHMPVKVHFDVISSIPYSTVQVYDNDTGMQMPQAYNAHITFDFQPNVYGYTVMGHGTLNKPQGFQSEAHWQLTVMTSINNVFHVCDNHETELCTILPLNPAVKLHIDEMYVPNRRNILGGIQISVTKIEAVSFRAAATTPDLEIIAVLRTSATAEDAEMEEVARCHGKGEIFWPYIRLKPVMSDLLAGRRSVSTGLLEGVPSTGYMSARSLKGIKKQTKPKSSTKVGGLNSVKPPPEPKIYTIEVIAPNGWALPLNQWRRVNEVRNDIQIPKYEPPPKPKPAEKKTGSARDKKEKDVPDRAKESEKVPAFTVHLPQPEDAFLELECSTTLDGGAFAKRDDDRDIQFAKAMQSWESKEYGRSARGAKIREEFREEFLVSLAPAKSESESSVEIVMEEIEGEMVATKQRPTPASETTLSEMTEIEEESVYFQLPEQLRDKFVALYYVPLCIKEKSDEQSELLTEEMAEAAKRDREIQVEMAIQRMRELQIYNEAFILGRQKIRCIALEKLGIDSTWNPELAQVLEERDEAIARESLERQLSAAKKKLDAKTTKK